MDGFTYSDVLALPVYERRFFLSLKARDVNKQKEQQEEQSKAVKSNSKGSRTTNISGENLKNRMKNGDLPLN
jgi:hypothetical protein